MVAKGRQFKKDFFHFSISFFLFKVSISSLWIFLCTIFAIYFSDLLIYEIKSLIPNWLSIIIII